VVGAGETKLIRGNQSYNQWQSSGGTMRRLFKIAFVALVACSCAIPVSAQCGFAIVPAADVDWYREAGWETPGVADAKSILKVNLTVNGKPHIWPDGITVSAVVHDDGYRVSFPEAVFDVNGAHKKMLQRDFLLKQLLRWEMNGKPYAYSYYLLPLDVLCTATIDVIDDKGDGKFRLMSPAGHVIWGRNPEPPPLPTWLQKPKS
jgi:hypothetical protein